tara:strand:+ start:322 stop:663 length:342 start_codon:yes stop_codon:yes gene_type:complete
MNISVYYIICVVVRCTLIYIAYVSLSHSYGFLLFSCFYLVLGVGSIYQYLTKYRKKGAFGQSIWWDSFRPIRGILYLSVSYFIYMRELYFVPILIVDTVMGISGHVYHRYIKK